MQRDKGGRGTGWGATGNLSGCAGWRSTACLQYARTSKTRLQAASLDKRARANQAEKKGSYLATRDWADFSLPRFTTSPWPLTLACSQA